MTTRSWSAGVLSTLFALGCHPNTPPESAPNGAEQAQSPEDDCPPASPVADAGERYQRGVALIESCGEECMKSAQGGGARYEGLTLVKQAAESDHLAAQSLYGRTTFGDLMTTGTEPELREQYEEALFFLAIAARRGDEDAKSYLPGFADLRVDEAGNFSAPLEGPLPELDEAWIKSALERAEKHMDCSSAAP